MPRQSLVLLTEFQKKKKVTHKLPDGTVRN